MSKLPLHPLEKGRLIHADSLSIYNYNASRNQPESLEGILSI